MQIVRLHAALFVTLLIDYQLTIGLNNSHLNKERELLLRVSQGDEGAFGEIYRFFYAELRPLARKYADSGIEAEEILQETFLKVWLNRDKLPELDNVRAWIFKVAYREFLIALRKKVSHAGQLKQYSALLEGNTGPESPYEITHLEEVRQCIQTAIHQLSPQRKAIYEMSRRDGLKINEIADRLSISSQTVHNVLQIVLKIIREHLTAAGHVPVMLLLFLPIFPC